MANAMRKATADKAHNAITVTAEQPMTHFSFSSRVGGAALLSLSIFRASESIQHVYNLKSFISLVLAFVFTCSSS